jgi:N-acetyltransferase
MEKFDFARTYQLEDNRVLLRPIAEADYAHLLPFSLNEPEIWRYSLQQAGGEEKLRAYIDFALKGREARNAYCFIVYDKQKQRYCGSTRFYDIQLDYNSLQLGYTWYGKEFQGTGINAHCKYLLLEFAFDRLGMERVEFRADNNNARSIAAMKSIGCVVEGVLRKNMPAPDGGRRDSIILSILKEEWVGRVKELLRGKMDN